MMQLRRHRSVRKAVPVGQRAARPPVVVPRPLLVVVRPLWIVIALAALLVWIVETPYLFHSALQLHNTSGMVSMRPAAWRLGLHRLGLSPGVYAAVTVAGLFLMSGSMFVVGLVIFLRRSWEWIALLVSYAFVGLGAGIVDGYAGGAALRHAHPNLTQPLDIFSALTSASYYALFLIPLLFPDGRFAPRWVRWIVVVVVVIAVAPFSLPVWIAGPIQVLGLGIVLLSPIYRYRRISDPTQREQTKWVIFGLLVSFGAYLSLYLIEAIMPGVSAHPERKVLLSLVGGSIAYLALSFLAMSFAIAILKYRLWDIDVLINRALVYGSLTLTLVALYIGGVILLQSAFSALTGQSSDLAVAVATLGIAALFNPWRHRLQRFIDRRFYRRKYDAARTLATFSARLRDEVNMDQLSASLLSVAHETMQPSSVALWFRESEGRPS